MDPLEDIRRRLECQVNEFFSPHTSNERKQQIGTLLETFSKQPGSWKQALYFLSKQESFSNEFLVMYCITVIENSVKNRWVTMSPQEKGDLQSTLYNFLIQHAAASSTSKCPNFIRNKIIKILTDVGKFSWPQESPGFMDNVLKISTEQDTAVIGLLFLKTISEEWINCSDEISTQRKIELKARLVCQLKRIFDLLHRLLATGLKHFLEHGFADRSNLILKEAVALSLETCGHLFSWIPFDGMVLGLSSEPSLSVPKTVPFTCDLLTVLCQLAGADLRTINESDTDEKSISIMSLNVLNELLYRKYVPKDMDDHINLVLTFGVELLCKMCSEMVAKTMGNNYLDKGIELLCLIANAYIFRYDKGTTKQFVTFLLRFTFAQTDACFYYECIEIWKVILDHMVSSEGPSFTNFSSRDELLDEFKPVLLDLAVGIVNSTVKFDDSQRDEYCEDEEDEDVEIQNLSKNIYVLVKIGELLPTESLERVTSTWTTSCQYFENLQSKLDQAKVGILLDDQINLKHFSFVVQLIGRIAEIFCGDVFKNELERGRALIHQLLGLMMISKNFYFVRNPEALVQANCEVVYAFRAWVYWLGRYYSEVIIADCSTTEEDSENFFQILTLAVDGLRFVLEHHGATHPNIVLANSNLFSLMVTCIRTQHIFRLPWVQTLITNIHAIRNSIGTDSFRMLNKSIACLLLVPWQNSTTAEQEWELRTRLYNDYMKNFITAILTEANNGDTPRLLLSIQILNDQIEILQTESPISKRICWNLLSQEVVPFMHKLAPAYIKRVDVSQEILNFFLMIMEVLRQQSGAQFFEQTVQIFLSLFTSANIINDLMKDVESSSVVVKKFIKMLEFMIKDPSPAFKKFLPACLSVALDHIYPVLAQRSCPDVKLVFFQFVRDAVNYRWNYFFPGFLYAAPPTAGGSPSSVSEEDAEVSKRLYQIFETIGQSFLQSDLEVFRFNLNTLTVWNQKHQIYSRLVIDLKMFDGFMSVLIQVLASKSHDLLKEEIAGNLYEMSLVDFQRFWQVFLPQTLQRDFPSVTEEQRVMLCSKFKPKTSPSSALSGNGLNRSAEKIDLTAFRITLFRLVDDLRFFHFYNECVKSESNEAKSQTSSGGSS